MPSINSNKYAFQLLFWRFVSNSYFTVIFQRFDYLSHFILMYAGLLLSRHTTIIQFRLNHLSLVYSHAKLFIQFNHCTLINKHSFISTESFIIHTDNFHSLIYLSLIMMTYYSLILTYRQFTVNNT